MKSILLKISTLAITVFLSSSVNENIKIANQEFQGQATYISKSTMDLGRWGARMSESQKKQIQANLKNRLEKEYILTFNREASTFYEDEKLDAMSGATDSWGKNFTPGFQYKNVKINSQIQSQEFYGKQFLVKDKLQTIDWTLGKDSKQIGNYTCFKAIASIPTDDLSWYNFSWAKLRRQTATTKVDSTDTTNAIENTVDMTEVEAWYTPQIPISHGPSEYWGLPGLILEVNVGNTTMLCSKIVLNPEVKDEIIAPEKGKVVTKKEYQATVTEKMQEFRNNRGRRRG
jgi:GLPGLI family protein